ncbi:MAG: hypothetical protein LQ340_006286 [Diploschistes diacapsis]|nr:MAG: hypothetical protein LQ340_006286 [Diploschistes diacapsis]
MASSTRSSPTDGKVKSEVVPPATNYAAREADQSRFLQRLADLRTKKAVVSSTRTKEIDAFRRLLETLCQRVVKHVEATTGNVDFRFDRSRLEIIGSYQSNLALSDESNLDFVLLSPGSTIDLVSPAYKIPQLLQQMFLSKGIGARLLTRTHAPMLVGCEKPNKDLLNALVKNFLMIDEKSKRYDLKSIEGREETEKLTVSEWIRRIELAAAEGWFEKDYEKTLVRKFKHTIEFPDHPVSPDPCVTQANLSALNDVLVRYDEPPDPLLEIPESGVGIRWTMRLADELALHNTQLLRCYGKCDHRVRDIVTFVKAWTKHRTINDTTRGTLSSYGYTIMTLHFLMNVVQPAVLPNLQQQLATHRGGSKDTPTMYNGKDIRFWRDEVAIQRAVEDGEWNENKEPVGSLLRGFFEYYDNPKAKLRESRFTWGLRVVSLRTTGGILTKEEKGWVSTNVGAMPTYYPWEKPIEIQHRHLLCVEDPFETDSNVGYSVSYPGMCKMKDEFKRARRIIENLGRFPGSKHWDLFDQGEQSDLDRPWLYFGRKLCKGDLSTKTSESQESLPATPKDPGSTTGISKQSRGSAQTHDNGTNKLSSPSCRKAPPPVPQKVNTGSDGPWPALPTPSGSTRKKIAQPKGQNSQ